MSDNAPQAGGAARLTKRLYFGSGRYVELPEGGNMEDLVNQVRAAMASNTIEPFDIVRDGRAATLLLNGARLDYAVVAEESGDADPVGFKEP